MGNYMFEVDPGEVVHAVTSGAHIIGVYKGTRADFLKALKAVEAPVEPLPPMIFVQDDKHRMCVCGHNRFTHDDHSDRPGHYCVAVGCHCLSFRPADPPKEAVDHPSHYGGADDPYEHIKVAEALGWGYHIGNCTKYLWRAGKKDSAPLLQDLKKARWYLDRFIQFIESVQGPPTTKA